MRKISFMFVLVFIFTFVGGVFSVSAADVDPLEWMEKGKDGKKIVADTEVKVAEAGMAGYTLLMTTSFVLALIFGIILLIRYMAVKDNSQKLQAMKDNAGRWVLAFCGVIALPWVMTLLTKLVQALTSNI